MEVHVSRKKVAPDELGNLASLRKIGKRSRGPFQFFDRVLQPLAHDQPGGHAGKRVAGCRSSMQEIEVRQRHWVAVSRRKIQVAHDLSDSIVRRRRGRNSGHNTDGKRKWCEIQLRGRSI